MKRFLLFIALTASALAVQAGPFINVGDMYDTFEQGKSTFLKRVYNSGDSTAFVRVNIFEITFDASGKMVETSLDSQGPAAADRQGLIASPARLIIPAGGTQGTRLVYRGARDKERYYRVRYLPVVPEREDQFEVSDDEREAYKAAMAAGVQVMAGYGTVVTVRPDDARYDTKIADGASDYRVTNAGNTTVVLKDFKDCPVQQSAECKPVVSHRLKPGEVFSFTKEQGRSYRFELVEGTSKKTVEVQ